MKKLAIAAAVALMAAGCAHNPQSYTSSAKVVQPQVNRAAKADKYVMPKAAPVEMPTPNQAVKKRWFDGFKIRLLHK